MVMAWIARLSKAHDVHWTSPHTSKNIIYNAWLSCSSVVMDLRHVCLRLQESKEIAILPSSFKTEISCLYYEKREHSVLYMQL